MSKKIMIVDDDEDIVESTKMLLEMFDYEVKTTFGAQTVTDIQEELPDLLLLDIRMSGMDGRTICQLLKSQEQTRHIPIIIFSASRDVADVTQKVGADDYLAKPFDADMLFAMINKYVGAA